MYASMPKAAPPPSWSSGRPYPVATGSYGPGTFVTSSAIQTSRDGNSFSVGQDVEMFSSHFNGWLPAKVVAVRPDGQVDVEAKIQKSFRPSEMGQLRMATSKFGRVPAGTQPLNRPQPNQITIMWQKGQQIWDEGYEPLKISLDWKVRDLIGKTGGIPPRSMYPNGKLRGVMHLSGPGTCLDLDDPANLEKPVTALNLSQGCEVSLLYGWR